MYYLCRISQPSENNDHLRVVTYLTTTPNVIPSTKTPLTGPNAYTGKKDNPPFNKVMNNGPLNGKLLLPESVTVFFICYIQHTALGSPPKWT